MQGNLPGGGNGFLPEALIRAGPACRAMWDELSFPKQELGMTAHKREKKILAGEYGTGRN